MTRVTRTQNTTPTNLLPDSTWRQSLRRAVLGWYEHHRRDLPWRRHRDPYAIWVSEIMLQQTQVATVKPYFERFMDAFPTVVALASADLEDVLRLWEGLGYYRRARQLHQAAQVIRDEHGGKFPTQTTDVRALPGVGRYTAGAIMSIAYDQREPILEGNTIRLYSRLLGFKGDPQRAAGQRLLWEFAEAILPTRHVGDFNQAMMELGSTVCQPRQPRCDACPLTRRCAAFEQGNQAEIPAVTKKLRYEDAHETAVIVRRDQRVLLRRCQPTERWAGLWDFPRFTTPQPRHPEELARAVQQQTGVYASIHEQLVTIKHAVTRFRITLDCFAGTYQRGKTLNKQDYVWVEPEALETYPLSVTGRKLSRFCRAV